MYTPRVTSNRNNAESVSQSSESNVSASPSQSKTNKGTKQRRRSNPPAQLCNDGQLKVWWNYWEARSWQHRHQVACWRSQVDALEYENRMLHEYIRTLLTGSKDSCPPGNDLSSDGGFSSPAPSLRSRRNRKRKNRRKRKAKNKDVSNYQPNESDSEPCSEFDEELLDFVEETFRHRLERDKHLLLNRHKSKTDYQEGKPECLQQPQLVSNRLEEMSELFGSAAPKLLAMETAMQLTFNSNCDRHQPRMWPVLPLSGQPE